MSARGTATALLPDDSTPSLGRQSANHDSPPCTVPDLRRAPADRPERGHSPWPPDSAGGAPALSISAASPDSGTLSLGRSRKASVSHRNRGAMHTTPTL